MEAMKKQFEYQLEEEELTHIRWFLTSVHRLKTVLLARQLLALGVMMTEKDGTHTTNTEKKNSNTVERETLQCDKIKSKRD